jgi:hypothetical protein
MGLRRLKVKWMMVGGLLGRGKVLLVEIGIAGVAFELLGGVYTVSMGKRRRGKGGDIV